MPFLMKGIVARFITSVLAYPIHSLNFLQRIKHHSYVSIVCYSYSPAMKETGSEF